MGSSTLYECKLYCLFVCLFVLFQDPCLLQTIHSCQVEWGLTSLQLPDYITRNGLTLLFSYSSTIACYLTRGKPSNNESWYVVVQYRIVQTS